MSSGWSRRIRTKVSPRAAQGFLYEIRFKTILVWKKAHMEQMNEILEVVRSSFGKYKITRNGKKRHITHYIVHVGSDADLMLLRMTDQRDSVFRIYRLSEKA